MGRQGKHKISSMHSRLRSLAPALLVGWISVACLCAGAVAQAGKAEPGSVDDPSAVHLRTTTRRVSVDIVVTGEKGKPVAGLSESDFRVFEDGVAQTLRSFDPHTPTTEVPYVAPHIPKLPPNTFLNLATAPTSGTPTVLLYDVINTPPESLGYAHEEMVQFIKHRKPGTQIAIFVLSDKLHLLQGFTDNADVLTSAINAQAGHVGNSTQLSVSVGNATSADVLAPSTAAALAPENAPASSAQTTGNTGAPQAAVSNLQSAEALEQSYMLDQRIEITLDGLTEIGRFLAGLPGRKNLVWLSASFPAGILPNGRVDVNSLSQDQSTRNFGEDIKEATDLLNLSHVAVYPVDVRGVIVSAPVGYSAASSKSYSQNGQGAASALAAETTDRASEYSTMDSIAESTGGRAFYATNDVQGAVNEAMENGSTYYSVTYAPSNPKLDGGLRKIRVTLDKPGYKLSYRTTYYADDLQRVAQEVADAPQSPLSPSLERGAPVSHELFVEARLQALGAPVAATAKQMEMLAEYDSVKSKKKKKSKNVALPSDLMMQNYLITYGLIPRQLDLRPEAGGVHKASLELGVLSYDQDGRKLNGVDTRIEDNIPAKRYALIPEEGYHLYQTVTIPVTASSVRLAVRDTAANHIGSLEVPLPLAKVP
jgi:VWFA-related protein